MARLPIPLRNLTPTSAVNGQSLAVTHAATEQARDLGCQLMIREAAMLPFCILQCDDGPGKGGVILCVLDENRVLVKLDDGITLWAERWQLIIPSIGAVRFKRRILTRADQ